MSDQFLTFVLNSIVCKDESLTNKKVNHVISHVAHREERKKEILEMNF